MARKEALMDLIKTIITAMAIGMGATIFIAKDMYESIGAGPVVVTFIAFTFILGGIVTGWIWADKLIIATGLKGLVFKLILSLILGWIALPVRIVKDMYHMVVV